MEDLQDKIIELMDLFDGEVTTADKINPPEPRKDVQDIEAINRFMRDNPPGMADGGMLVKPSVDGRRPGYAKISKISRDLKQTPTRTDIAVDKQKVVDDVLEQLVKEGNTTFEKVSEVIEKITAKGTMSKTTARTGIENSKFLSQFEFLGPGAGLDKEILESDWFKRNYPNATTIKEAAGNQALAKVRNQYKLAKERGFPLSQRELADEIGMSKSVLSDYISYSRTSKKPQNPTDISRVKRAKEFINLLKEAGITFSGGGQRYGSSDIRFIATPEQISNFKKTYEEDFLKGFTKEQKKLMDDTVRSTYDDMIESGNLMKKFEFAKLLKTKLGFGSVNAMTRAIDRVLSKKEIDVLPKAEFVSGGEREIKKRKSIEMAGDDANQIRKSQNRFLDVMKSEFKNMSDKDLLKLIKNTPQLLNQVTLRFDKKTGEFFNENIDDLDMDTIRKRSLPNVEHIKKVKEAGIQAEWPYNRQVAVSNINKHIKESVEGFINANEPLLKRKDIPIETKQKIKNQILNIENKMNEMNLRMFANNKYRGVPEGLPAIDRETGQLTSFFENVKSMGLKPETYSVKIPSKFKPIAMAAGLTGGLITAAAAETESPQQASNLLDNAKLAGAGTAGALAVGTKKGRNILGRTIGGAFGPTGLAGLTVAGGGYDLSSPLDRFILGTEAAFAPELVKGTIGATKGMKNRALQKVVQRALNLGMSVPTALKVARIASPLGLATLAGEGIYQVGKLGFEDQKRFDALTPEQQAAERAEQEAFAFDVQGAKDGGRMGFKVGSLRKGIQALIDKSVKSTPKDTTSALDKLIKKTLDEDLFDKKDRIIDQINISEAKKRKNYPYNQQVFEEPKNLDFYDAITKSNFRTKTGPYYDRIRKNKAGGGILKQAGDRSGPPPESGPNSQGLQGLLNRVKKI